ncbi:UNVERIFIED_CONTAM: hypothetical protein K2H54_055785 [Gekko kuhli]
MADVTVADTASIAAHCHSDARAEGRANHGPQAYSHGLKRIATSANLQHVFYLSSQRSVGHVDLCSASLKSHSCDHSYSHPKEEGKEALVYFCPLL